jgi:bifunctional enzyme CysN/CysC
VINKLDGVDYNEQVFKEIQEGLKETIERLEITTIQFVPVSALAGDNVVYGTENMPWHQGPTLLEYIQEWNVEDSGENLPRLNVQMISRAENFRGVAGTIIGGSFAMGDEVAVLPSKKTAKIAQLLTWVPHPSEMTGWDDPECDDETAAIIREACEIHGVDVPEHIIETR